MDRMEITVGSISDRENLVAELWYDDVMWAEISQENSEPILELYPHPAGKPWAFKFSEALAFLQQAMHRLEKLDEPRQEGEEIE